jgi:hypothetical protein
VGLRAGLDTEVTGKILCLCRGSNPDRPVVQPVVRHYTALANPAPPINLYDTSESAESWFGARHTYVESVIVRPRNSSSIKVSSGTI